jgi:hypothetical protein
MAASRVRRVARVGAGAPQWVAAVALLLAGAALAFGAAIGAPAASADAPTLTITLDKAGSTDTLSHFFAAGKGFAPNTAFTYTFGSFDPYQATTDASGNAYAASTVTVATAADWSATKFCATATITSGSATASASVWVGALTDSDTGTQCAPGSSSGGTPAASTTPTVDATAAAAASATAAAAPTATIVPAASAPDTSSGSGLGIRARLAKLPLGLIGGGLAALFVVIVIVVALSRRGNEDDMGGYSSPGARGGTGYRQAPRPGGGPPRQGPPRQGPPRGPDRGNSTYSRRY